MLSCVKYICNVFHHPRIVSTLFFFFKKKRTPAINRLAQANRAASHGPRVKAKKRAKNAMENPKNSPKDTKVPKTHAKGKTSKNGISSLENVEIRNKLGNSGISANGTCSCH